MTFELFTNYTLLWKEASQFEIQLLNLINSVSFSVTGNCSCRDTYFTDLCQIARLNLAAKYDQCKPACQGIVRDL